MAGYTLRNVDADLWKRVRIQAAIDGMSVRGVVLKLLALYAEGDLQITAQPRSTRDVLTEIRP